MSTIPGLPGMIKNSADRLSPLRSADGDPDFTLGWAHAVVEAMAWAGHTPDDLNPSGLCSRSGWAYRAERLQENFQAQWEGQIDRVYFRRPELHDLLAADMAVAMTGQDMDRRLDNGQQRRATEGLLAGRAAYGIAERSQRPGAPAMRRVPTPQG